MKKVAKTSLIGLSCLCPIVLIASFATNWKHQINISCVGSSGVKPFVEILCNNNANNNFDITVEAGGSGFGIEELAKNHCNIGTSSTNPYELVNSSKTTLQAWNEKRIKTITLGWEAICLVYKLPSFLSKEEQKHFEISINEENIEKLFSIFSGFKNNNDPKWKDFIKPDCLEYLNNNQMLSRTTIIPYVRSGGNTTSGTAAAFCLETHFENFSFDKLSSAQQKAFSSGQYGSDYEMYQTDEANSRSWDMFCKNDIPGSMIYLSAGFVEANMQLIKEKGYKIAWYKDHEYTIQNVEDKKYKWFRPINCSFSLENENIINVIQNIVMNNKENNKKNLMNNGGIFVNDIEIESMKLNDTNWLSDIELQEQRDSQNKKIYGAIPNW